jgi:superfamily II DNA helicase RecQ
MFPEDEAKQELEMEAAPEKEKHENKKPAFKPEDLKSLNDYYQIKKLPATRFLTALKKNKISKLQEDDVQRCLDGLDERDPEFARTQDLLFRAASAQSPLARQCITFASQACRQQLSKHYQVNLDLSKSANDVFAEVFRGLKPGLMGKKVDNRSVNLLKAVGIWKSHSRNLDEVETVEFLVKEFISNKSSRNGGIPAVFEILFRPANKIKTMLDMLRVTEHVLIKAQHAREAEIRERHRRDKEARRAQDYLDQLREARAGLERREEEIAGLSAKLKASEDERASLEKRVEHQQAISAHGEGELKGRARVFLEKKLSPLLETAHEFAELDPPRKSIIVERLEMAREEIRREIEWLKSTD